jgi:aminoglycoside phosphotransferase (APT) family kinase protein
MSATIPTFDDLRIVAHEGLGAELRWVERFANGLCHYVYDAALADGRAVVLRLAAPENAHYLRGAVHWSKILRALGLPIPTIFHAQLAPARCNYPYLILQRLPGNDLGDVYSQLNGAEKSVLATKLAQYQQTVATLPTGSNFGYQTDPQIPPPYINWNDVVAANIDRSEGWITQSAVDDGRRIDLLRKITGDFDGYFHDIAPLPFLDDITTKNVLIHEGQLSGIVDTDEICFGDRVAHLGLTRMALLARDLPTDYIDYWCGALQLNAPQRHALDLYTAEACLSFLGELGQSFNREQPTIDHQQVHRLKVIFDNLIAKLH